MILIPAIDLYRGRCVRLFQGKFDHITYYDVEPDDLAKRYSIAGAKWLHLVNLDGAEEGSGFDYATLRQLCESTGLRIQCGGGFRTQESIQRALQIGVGRVVVGSLVLTEPDVVKACIHDYGTQCITLALDVRFQDGQPQLASHGWKEQSSQSLWDTLEEYSLQQITEVLCTDISKDGAMSGPNFDLYTQCVERFPNIRFQASGGVRNLDDLKQLEQCGVDAAIVGRALYEEPRLMTEAASYLPGV